MGPDTPESGSESLTWLGHSTVLIEIASVRLLTDPVLRNRVAHLRRIGGPAIVPDHVDGVLISHAHHDHLDPRSLRLLGRSTPIVLPRGAGRMLRRRGFTDITEIEAGRKPRSAECGFERPTPSTGPAGGHSPHVRRRSATWWAGTPPIGDHWRAYFAGDTDLFDGMESLAGRIDVALLPVAGWGRRVPAGHLTPRRAAEAAQRLTPTLAIPIHWGTLAEAWVRRKEPDRAPALEFERELADLDPAIRVEVLEPGTSIEF